MPTNHTVLKCPACSKDYTLELDFFCASCGWVFIYFSSVLPDSGRRHLKAKIERLGDERRDQQSKEKDRSNKESLMSLLNDDIKKIEDEIRVNKQHIKTEEQKVALKQKILALYQTYTNIKDIPSLTLPATTPTNQATLYYKIHESHISFSWAEPASAITIPELAICYFEKPVKKLCLAEDAKFVQIITGEDLANNSISIPQELKMFDIKVVKFIENQKQTFKILKK